MSETYETAKNKAFLEILAEAALRGDAIRAQIRALDRDVQYAVSKTALDIARKRGLTDLEIH